MSDDFDPDDIDVKGRKKYPVTKSVKINGPPGTGKTTQGIARVHKLITEHGYDVEDVSWSTFRRHLADELVSRFEKWGLITEEERRNSKRGRTSGITSSHATAFRMQSSYFGRFDTPTWREWSDFMQSVYNRPYSVAGTANADPVGEYLFDVYYWCKNNRLPPEQAYKCPRYDDLQDSWRTHPTLTEFEEEWEEYKDENELVDFHQYLERALEKELTPDKDIVVIDEYHDAFPLLHELAQLWLEDAEVGIVLGDPQQVINVHQGADPSHFEELDLPEVLLDETHRVPPVHWHAATSILDGFHDPYEPDFNTDDDVDAELEDISSPEFHYNKTFNTWETPDIHHYASPVSLAREHDDEKVVFLTRVKQMLRGLQHNLKEGGVLYTTQLGDGWKSKGRRRRLYDALQRLHGVYVDGGTWDKTAEWHDWAEETDAIDTSGNPPEKLRKVEAKTLLRHTDTEHLTLSRDGIDNEVRSWDNHDATVPFSKVAALVEESFWTSLTEGPYAVEELVNREKEDGLERETLQNALFNNGEPIMSLHPYADDADSDPFADLPHLMTIHASKGSEADVSVVYDGITQKIQNGIDRSVDVAANEDRVWYVALTRAARKNIIVRDAFSWADSYIPRTLTMGVTA